MFFVVNKTKNRITLGDLNITLGPRQAIDLDKIMKREKSEGSKHLKAARAKGDIEIRMKDGLEKQEVIKEIIVEKSDSVDFEKIKNDIVSELKGSIKELTKQIISDKSSQSQLSQEDIEKISNTIIKNLPSKNSENIKLDSEEDELNKDVLVDINVRAVNKMVKNTNVEAIKYKEEKSDSRILGNMDELESLLG